jgi:chitinase
MSPHKRPATLACGCALATAAAAGVTFFSATAASAATSWPAHVMAPYVDTGFSSANTALSGSTLSTIASDYGDKYFTLAFVGGSGCQWSMYNSATYQSEVNSLRSAGGDAIISFGGWTADNGGTDLGAACSSAGAAATQIEGVVNYFGATRLDFDIESNALSNHNDVDLTNQALALVRSWASSSGLALSISYTIPVLPSGLTSDGLYVLTDGQSHGFRPDVVNIMAMDYGTSGTEMGTAAEQALDATAGQVASTYGISSASAYAMMGLTPMIGQNDSAGEVFSLSDASTVESYAASKGIALLSFWSEGRDNGGCPGQTSASSTCSGISQNTGQFTTTFNPFTGGSSSGGGGGSSSGTGGAIIGYAGLCVDVQGSNTANFTPVQVYTCNGTNAQRWTVDTSNNTLQALGKCMDIYAGGTANGTTVDLYDCNGTGAQIFVPQSNGSLYNPQSGKCLDDTGWSTTPGTQLEIWDCTGNANQHWNMPGPIVSGVSSSLCVDDQSSNTTNFNPIQIWSCNGTSAQAWTVVPADNTLHVLGKCMDVNSGGTTDGTKIDLYDCNGTGAQVWVPQSNGSLLNPQSGKCLDDPGASSSPGTQLQIWDCNSTVAQHWTLSQP